MTKRPQPSTSYQSYDLYDDDHHQFDDLFNEEEEEVVAPLKCTCKACNTHPKRVPPPFSTDVKLSKKLVSKKETVSNYSQMHNNL